MLCCLISCVTVSVGNFKIKVNKFKLEIGIPHFQRVFLNSLKDDTNNLIDCKAIEVTMERVLEFIKSTHKEN